MNTKFTVLSSHLENSVQVAMEQKAELSRLTRMVAPSVASGADADYVSFLIFGINTANGLTWKHALK